MRNRFSALAIACGLALIVAVFYPRDQWVSRRQIEVLSEPETDWVHEIRGATRITAPSVDRTRSIHSLEPIRDRQLATQKVKQEPLFRAIAAIAEPNYGSRFSTPVDPKNERGYWSVIARKTSIVLLPSYPMTNMDTWRTLHITQQLNRPEDTQMKYLLMSMYNLRRVKVSSYYDERLHARMIQTSLNCIRMAAQNVRKGGDYAKYENGWKMEREAILRVLDGLQSYSGQDRIAEVDRMMDFSDAAALKQFPRQILPYASVEVRKDLALVAANLIRQGDPAILMVVGRSMLADTIKPEGATYREPEDHPKLIEWAAQRDVEFKTGNYFRDLVASNELSADVSAPARGVRTPPDPMKVGAFLLCALIAMGASFASLCGLLPFAQNDSVVKMRSHLLAALGWLVAVAIMPEVGTAIFGLVALSHVGLSFAVLGDRAARIGTTLLGVLALYPVVNPQEGSEYSNVLLAVLFGVIAVLSWTLKEEKRWRMGLLMGWAVTLVCFGFAGVGLATLLPAVGWGLGLYLETRKGPANVNHIAATMLLAAGAAGLIFVLHPGWAAGFAGLGLSFVSATTVYRTHRQAVIGAAVACATIFATLYVGTVAWTLRYDRQNEAAIRAYLTEADRLRPISSR